MKKYFFILSLLCLALVSCENDEPEPEPVKDPLDYTLVHITEGDYSEITGVFTVNGYDNTVEIGFYPGNYYIKKNSTIRINWTYHYYNGYEYNGNYSEEFTVGNAQELWIYVGSRYANVRNEQYDTY